MKPLHFKLASLALWLALLAVAFTAPPAAPDTAALIAKMVSGHLAGVNVSLFALFNLMGVWPLAMAIALRFDAPWWKWPFIAGSFALGAFVLLPWFVLRRWGAVRAPPASVVGRFLSSVWLMRAVGVAGAAFLALFAFGDVTGFVTLWKTQQFPYVMSFDFVAMTLAAGLLGLEQVMRRALSRG